MRTPPYCRSCGAEVTWGIFTSGKRVPLDRVSTADGNVVQVFDERTREFVKQDGTPLIRVLRAGEEPDSLTRRYVVHFTTCPNADEHLRR